MTPVTTPVTVPSAPVKCGGRVVKDHFPMRWAFALLLVVWLPPESAPFSLTPSRTLRRARPARRAQLQPLIDEGALAREGPVRLPLPRADMPQISACDLPGAPSMRSSTVTLFLPTELIRIMRATAPTLPRSHTCVCLPRRRDDTRRSQGEPRGVLRRPPRARRRDRHVGDGARWRPARIAVRARRGEGPWFVCVMRIDGSGVPSYRLESRIHGGSTMLEIYHVLL